MAVRRREEFRRQGPANTAFQTAQQIYPACTGGSCETGPQTESRASLDPRKREAEGEPKPSNPGRGPEDGRVSDCRGSPRTRLRACRRAPYNGSLNRRPPGRKRLQDSTARRLPGPAGGRLSEGDQTPEAPFGLFQDWQRAQTQSSVMAFGPETANGCPVLQRAGTTAERHTLRAESSAGISFARSS